MTRLAIDGGPPVRRTLLDHRRGANRLGAEERAALLAVLDSKSLFRYYGPDPQHSVAGFEGAVEALLGLPHALATSSGTAALIAGLAALGVGPGDEVVVPAVTFIATANAVVVSGAVPIFCDVDRTLGLDPDHLTTLINERTAAVLPVHLENVVCEMAPLLAIAERHGIPVLEDACQAMGATYHGTPAGAFGAMGAFSLQLEKNITAGEGGVLVTRDPDLHARAVRYTDQGGQFVTAHGGARGDAQLAFVGENLRMAELAGAVAGVQLRRLPGLLADMRAAKRKLVESVGERPGLVPRTVPDPDGDGGSSVIWFGPDAGTAARFVSALQAEGIPSAQLYD
ncbi:MAG TPA: aminotransferase class I/II-fold pyridoxal phosphate-dependent enzyme, partial [Mycobacteriales bacterium]|nr:aminotransferase class I/II-fold pyridoxal phosphate-dependent enzyme [Mycobacteriales bacterium]